MPGRDLKNSGIEEEQEEEDERSSYYCGANVPFIWESRPGTPKHYLDIDTYFPPPLTPPPSYYSSSSGMATPRKQNKVRTTLRKILSISLFHDLRKSSHTSKKTTNNVYGSSFSWSSTSSSSSFASSPQHSLKKPRDKKSPVQLADNKEDELRLSPTSTLCYSNGGRNGFSSSMESMKRALFYVPKHGSTGKPLIINDMNKA